MHISFPKQMHRAGVILGTSGFKCSHLDLCKERAEAGRAVAAQADVQFKGAGFPTCLRGPNPKRNLGLSESEGPRFPLRIRFGVFWGLQRRLSGHEGVVRRPQGEDIPAIW